MQSPAVSWYELVAKSPTQPGEMVVYGFIGPGENIDEKAFIRDFATLAATHPAVNLRLNSGGGSVFAGVPIYNAIASSPVPVSIVVEGMAASMASILLQAAGPGGRKAYKNARVMVHKPSGGIVGSAQKMRQTADLLDSLETTLADIYVERTGQPAAVVNTWLTEGEDRWFTAAEALAAGLLDEVLSTAPTAPAPPKSSLSESAMYAHYQAALTQPPPAPVVATQAPAPPPVPYSAMTPQEIKMAVLLNLLTAQGRLPTAQHASFLSLSRTNYDATVTVLASLPTGGDGGQHLPQAAWGFDRFRREAPAVLERMRANEPNRFEALRDLYVAAIRRGKPVETPADRLAARVAEQQHMSYAQLRKEAPRVLEQMQANEPAKYERLRAVYLASLKGK